MKVHYFAKTVVSLLIFLPLFIVGCEKKEEWNMTEEVWSPAYELTEENLIYWDNQKEIETDTYYVVEEKSGEGEEEKSYPQIVRKVERDFLCGEQKLNELLKQQSFMNYNILYADSHYLCLWYGSEQEKEQVSEIQILNLESICTEGRDNGSLELYEMQGGIDFSNSPWPSNGLSMDLNVLLQEIEKGNCYLDEEAYALWQKNPEEFIESVRRQFYEIANGGIEELYSSLTGSSGYYSNSKMPLMMYVREGRVGFYICSLEQREDNEGNPERGEYHYDFRIEIAYDWKQDAPIYHLPYEVYGVPYKEKMGRTVYYPQVDGLEETVQNRLNQVMKEDMLENLPYVSDLERWNASKEGNKYYEEGKEIIFYSALPEVNNPMVAYRSERYLCIRQDIITSERDVLRFAEDWRRYHVYDLSSGESLRLGDILQLNQRFIMWLKTEKKFDANNEWYDLDSPLECTEYVKENLDIYPKTLLLEVLNNAEFWMKDGQLFIRFPYCDEFGSLLYAGGGTDWPNYLQYSVVRIQVEDLKEFLKVEQW